MGLRITRLERNAAKRESTPSMSSVWSARDLCPLDMLGQLQPTCVEQVVPQTDGHLSETEVKELFDRLWTKLRDQRSAIVELEMTHVKTADARFASELDFFRRQLHQQGSEVRVRNFP